ncbi:MAG TPA: hypothetical protein VIL95_03875 [Bacillota bacterium]
MAKLGLDAAVICTDAFRPLAVAQARALGRPDLPLLVIPHPLGGLKPEEARARSRAVLEALSALGEEGGVG